MKCSKKVLSLLAEKKNELWKLYPKRKIKIWWSSLCVLLHERPGYFFAKYIVEHKKNGGSIVTANYRWNVAFVSSKNYMPMMNTSSIETVLIYIFRLCSIVICTIVWRNCWKLKIMLLATWFFQNLSIHLTTGSPANKILFFLETLLICMNKNK